ncbi:hypothetical protein AMIS_51240 [Actinoplanes missouriensis 431]|uniref:Uncharacterized protein n=1 Tax=Actinoplanes missouriensis (strain ATCC 14538 / DSM 43046 / CBS 188.64 / JCM 3121 / NBRC 102363 / NCIMB 12654 / NRRL B-3342 / UNCC 431) TaxID=512565 RepID=I0HBF7_ACTM4|nr:hypothetical protein AMIS_51240 [Actinoplanes missouriensis 431]
MSASWRAFHFRPAGRPASWLAPPCVFRRMIHRQLIRDLSMDEPFIPLNVPGGQVEFPDLVPANRLVT